MFAISLTILATLITYLINPDVNDVLDGIGNQSSDTLSDSRGIHKVWAFIVNNGFSVPLQMFLLALIPIQFLYVLNIMTTVSLPGILFGIALRIDADKGFGMIFSSIPHFVFEIFAFCLLAATLFELNRAVRIKIKNLFKTDKVEISFNEKLVKAVKFYGIFVLPIITIAAFLETYAADLIYQFFQ
ncbi:stage II sporulation protein M [Lederbergia citrisecunda]|uniref:stage II sporulation protein M n=1 Tax=Lederbergia citrisecunda TaxID=2833583 RepID=UPI0022854707